MRRGPKRYYRLEGVDIGSSSLAAVQVKVGGVWHWIPKSVIADGSMKRNTERPEADELALDEWFAQDRGWC